MGTIKGKQVDGDPDPVLHGWWGSDPDDERTMTHQAVEIGLPSFQMEHPSSFRAMLFRDEALLDRYAAFIAASYRHACITEAKYGINKTLPLPGRPQHKHKTQTQNSKPAPLLPSSPSGPVS